MVLNIDKTNVMLITSMQKRTVLNDAVQSFDNPKVIDHLSPIDHWSPYVFSLFAIFRINLFSSCFLNHASYNVSAGLVSLVTMIFNRCPQVPFKYKYMASFLLFN